MPHGMDSVDKDGNKIPPLKKEIETMEEKRIREKQEEDEKKKKEMEHRNYIAYALSYLSEKDRPEAKKKIVQGFTKTETDVERRETVTAFFHEMTRCIDNILDVNDRIDKLFEVKDPEIKKLLKEDRRTYADPVMGDALKKMVRKDVRGNIVKTEDFKLSYREHAVLCQAVLGKEDISQEEAKYASGIVETALKKFAQGDSGLLAKLVSDGIRLNNENSSKFTDFTDVSRYSQYTRDLVSLVEEHPEIAKHLDLTDEEMNKARGNMARGFIYTVGLESQMIIAAYAGSKEHMPDDLREDCLKNIMAMYAFSDSHEASGLGKTGFTAEDLKKGIMPTPYLNVLEKLADTKASSGLKRMNTLKMAEELSQKEKMTEIAKEAVGELKQRSSVRSLTSKKEEDNKKEIEKEIEDPIREKDPIMLDVLQIGAFGGLFD